MAGEDPSAVLHPDFADVRLQFEHISVEQGLSQSTVKCILQDRSGFMWFCTEDGLSRFDGYGFTVFRHDPTDHDSLSHDVVNSLYEDAEGMLWVGTQGGGLDKFDRQTGHWRNFRIGPEGPDSLLRNWIVSIVEDENGLLWIGTYGGGLYQLDRTVERFNSIHERIHPWISKVLKDRSGIVWVGTDGRGLYRIDPSTGQLSHFQHDPSVPNSLSSDRVLEVYEDRSGTVWIGTLLGGLDMFEPDTGTFFHFQNDPNDSHSLGYHIVSSIYEDRSGVLWIGTGGGGLDRLDRSKGGFVHYQDDPSDSSSLSSNTILTMNEDKTGAVWIGTMGGGVNRLVHAAETFDHYRNNPNDRNSLTNNTVRALWQDGAGDIWIGTDGGLSRFDRDAGQWTHYHEDPSDPNSLSANGVRSILQDRSGRLWVGIFGGGLNRFDPESQTFAHFFGDHNVEWILEDQQGMLWLATLGQGLYQFDPDTGTSQIYTQQDGLSSDFVRTLLQGGSGALWIGTDDGLDRFEPWTGQWRRYRHDPNMPGSLGRGWVSALHEDPADVLWIGTAGGGLNRLDPATDTLVHYTEQDGLANDEVYGILQTDTSPGDTGGRLWLSTNNGLSRFDPGTETFKNFGSSGDLPINKFLGGSYHMGSQGEMFFGGVNGFVVFDPAQVNENRYVPPIVLTSLTQNGTDLDPGTPVENLKELALHWPNNSFEFEFAALSYTQSERNQHAYMLEGFDDDWIYLGNQRSGRYTNLPGGTYVLRLIGSNNDGVWNEEGTGITITVVPPVWQRGWFWGIVGLALIAGTFGSYRFRIRNLEARSRELEMQIKERTAELSRSNLQLEQEIMERRLAEEALAQKAAEDAVVAERGRLARELHDAVTQTLFSTSLIAETLPRSWERDQERGRQLLQELRQLSRGALAEMRTLLLELRPAALIETDLGDLLRQLAEAAAGQSGLPVRVTVEGECALPPDVHLTFYRIAQEALNNAVKHAQAEEVMVHFKYSPPQASGAEDSLPKRVELRVSDDGRGFSLEHALPDRLGLEIMQERAQAVGATLAIESEMGSGTNITVRWEEGDSGHE